MRRPAPLFAAPLLAATLAAAPSAAAQDGDGESELQVPPARARPTSGEASLSSGRTLGVGETLIAGAAGWPWIWAQVTLAPTSSFNLGVRAALLYGSSIMAFEPAVGGELSAPMRVHLFGEGEFDLAAFLTPAFTVGEAAGVGEGGTVWAGDLGWSSRLELGGLIGWRPMERFTLLVGLGGYVGFVHTPSVGDPEVVGGVLARVGVEGLISRDTMLFAVADGGLGFAPQRGAGAPLFRAAFPPIFRVSLGVAYLL